MLNLVIVPHTVPEGFGPEADVSFVDALAVYVGLPLALFAIVSLIAYAPVLIKRQRERAASEEGALVPYDSKGTPSQG